MHPSRRTVLAAIGGAATCALHLPARAAWVPERPITLLLGVPPGGSLDVQARVLAQHAGRHLGQPVVVNYRPGASATLAPSSMAQTAAADGYTVSIMPTTLFRLPHLQKVTFDPIKDFSYIINVASQSFAVVVPTASPFKTFQDILAHAKATPGKLSYATQGAGGTTNICMEQIAKAAGTRFTYVPYKGAAEVWQAVAAGHVDMAADTGFAATVDAGRGRLVAVLSEQRLRKWPQVPTLRDLGFDFAARGGWGIGGPRGMAPEVMQALHDAFRKAMDEPAFQQTVEQQDQVTTYMDTKTYTQWAARQVQDEQRALSSIDFKLQ